MPYVLQIKVQNVNKEIYTKVPLKAKKKLFQAKDKDPSKCLSIRPETKFTLRRVRVNNFWIAGFETPKYAFHLGRFP